MKKTALFLAISALGSAPAFAQFTNGGFEAGDTTGWSPTSSVQRSSVDNTNLTPNWITTRYGTSPSIQRSAIVTTADVDPNVGAAMGSLVQSGNYAYRVEDTVAGGYASVISQSVTNYQDANIFFAWKAVLLGAHNENSAATMKIVLRDDTAGVDLLTREYNAASGGSGIDPRFSLSGNNYYTAQWQIEAIALGAAVGHDITLSVLASDCSPTAHWGYVYLDGFGRANPTPEPASLALLAAGLFGVAASRRRKAV